MFKGIVQVAELPLMAKEVMEFPVTFLCPILIVFAGERNAKTSIRLFAEWMKIF